MVINKTNKKIPVSLYCKNINNKYKPCNPNLKIKTGYLLSYKKSCKKWRKTPKMMNKY